MATLQALHFDNATIRELPLDKIVDDKRTRPVPGACYSRVPPTPLENPVTVAVSDSALELLDLDPSEAARPEFAQYFGGNKLLPGSEPVAHCYCGYQFGYFSGQLGDGAAISLGEVVNKKGERWELQLKGAGPTPYSRAGDGRKVLRSSIREFLVSEAMHGLGIPTTRAASVVTSDSKVARDMFYDGNTIFERCSVVSRLAPTFMRFGSFEIFNRVDPMTGRGGPSAGREEAMLPTMLDHVIRTHYPDVWAAFEGVADPKAQQQQRYLEFFREITRRTSNLVAAWQCVGWCHGVLNTDNMSIIGVTLDYGPFAFLDRYDPRFICNGSDDTGRYTYEAQPEICRWNVEKLAEALKPVLPLAQSRPVVAGFMDTYQKAYDATMRRKLGLVKDSADEAGDAQLVKDLLQVMEETGADFTNTFRALSRFPMPAAGAAPAGPSTAAAIDLTGADAAGASGSGLAAQLQYADGGVLAQVLEQLADVETMKKATKPRIPEENLEVLARIAAKDRDMLHTIGATPELISREVAQMRRHKKWAAATDASKAADDRAQWTAWLNRYGARLAREAAAGASAEERVKVMNATNPRVVLRNWIAQQAIQRAEKADYEGVREVLRELRDPFAEGPATGGEPSAPEGDVCRFSGKPPGWARDLCITCSS